MNYSVQCKLSADVAGCTNARLGRSSSAAAAAPPNRKLAQKLCVWQACAPAELDPICLLSSCGWMHQRTIWKVVELMQQALRC